MIDLSAEPERPAPAGQLLRGDQTVTTATIPAPIDDKTLGADLAALSMNNSLKPAGSNSLCRGSPPSAQLYERLLAIGRARPHLPVSLCWLAATPIWHSTAVRAPICAQVQHTPRLGA